MCLEPLATKTCNHPHLRFIYILRLNQSSKERVPPERLWISAREAEAASGGAFRSQESPVGFQQSHDSTNAVLRVFMDRGSDDLPNIPTSDGTYIYIFEHVIIRFYFDARPLIQEHMGRLNIRVQSLEAKVDAMGSQLSEMHRLLMGLSASR